MSTITYLKAFLLVVRDYVLGRPPEPIVPKKNDEKTRFSPPDPRHLGKLRKQQAEAYAPTVFAETRRLPN